jgi:hypothetical protein
MVFLLCTRQFNKAENLPKNKIDPLLTFMAFMVSEINGKQLTTNAMYLGTEIIVTKEK